MRGIVGWSFAAIPDERIPDDRDYE